MASKTPRPAAFLDRDGVLNMDNNYVHRPEDFLWVPGAREAVRLLNDAQYWVFVVTNQSGVARGFYSEADVVALHRWINVELGKAEAWVDVFFYCPHHPQAKLEAYRRVCQCRKPAPGMLRQAFEQWPVKPEGSFLIGDNQSDIEAARTAGLAGHLFTRDNLAEKVREILGSQNR